MLSMMSDVTEYLLLLILLPLILVGLYGLNWFLRRPPRYRKRVDDDLSKFFKALLYDDYKSGFLTIEAPNKKRFLQFLKYKDGKEAGVQFDFPLAPWSERYADPLKTLLHEQGVDYEVSSTGNEPVTGFITIDFEQDCAKAMGLAKLALLEVFKLRPDDRIKLYLSK